MTIGSLFSGIGGLELGLERAGLGPVLWQAEAEEFPRRVLAKHWPNAKRFEDVRSVTAETAEPVDLVCGGFPCQDISLAGKGAGLAGERSGLWYEYARIVRELRPRWVVAENVAALLSRGLDAVLGTLAALGYDAVWDCIPAQAVGAPHRRDRVFLVARRVSDAERDAVREEPSRGSWLGDGARSPFARHLGAVMADAYEPRAQRQHAAQGRSMERAGDRNHGESSGALANAECLRRNGRTGQGEESAGRGQPSDERSELADTNGKRRSGEGVDGARWPRTEGDESDGGCKEPLANANGRRPQGKRERGLLDGERASLGDDVDGCNMPLWPPPPGDMHAWGRVPAYAQPAICRLDDGLPAGLVRNRRHALKGYGNAVVPAVAEVIGRFIVEADRRAA